jgi:hypothetical protein
LLVKALLLIVEKPIFLVVQPPFLMLKDQRFPLFARDAEVWVAWAACVVLNTGCLGDEGGSR